MTHYYNSLLFCLINIKFQSWTINESKTHYMDKVTPTGGAWPLKPIPWSCVENPRGCLGGCSYWINRGFMTFMHHVPQQSVTCPETLLYHFKAELLRLLNASTLQHRLVMNYLRGRKFHKLTVCNSSICCSIIKEFKLFRIMSRRQN